MDRISLIKKAGLSEAQAKAYLALIQNGKLSPARLSKLINENRTNCYALLDKLEKYHLATKTKDKRTSYRPTHPSNLEALAEERRRTFSQNEKFIKDNISTLLDTYYAHNEALGARTYQGLDGVKKIYDDIIRSGNSCYRICSNQAQVPTELLQDFYLRLSQRNIEIFLLTPNPKAASTASANFHITSMPESAFPASTEINIYGDKLAFINYGETQNSAIIMSPAIAHAMKLVFNTLQNHWQDNHLQD